MKIKKYVIMGRDELGDPFRAHGSSALSATYEFPDYSGDAELFEAFCTWEDALINKLQTEWNQIYGNECRIYLEETYESQFKNNQSFLNDWWW